MTKQKKHSTNQRVISTTLVVLGLTFILWPLLLVLPGQYPGCVEQLVLGSSNFANGGFISYIHVPSIAIGLACISWGISRLAKKFSWIDFFTVFGVGIFPVYVLIVAYISFTYRLSPGCY